MLSQTMQTDNKQTEKISAMENDTKEEQKAMLRLDILRSFGADLGTGIRENLVFINRALCYPVGRNICLKNIFFKAEHGNDQLFIYLENNVLNITSMNANFDNLLLVCLEYRNKAEIDVYNLSKLSFNYHKIFRPQRKVISTQYTKFIYCSFSPDGNNLACLGETKEGKLQGVVYDIQNFVKFKKDNYTPIVVFDVPNGTNLITYENKVICTSGKFHLSFWFIFEGMAKEYKSVTNISKNYSYHCWIKDSATPTLAALTEDNEIYIFTALLGNRNDGKSQDDFKIERFMIKQVLTNIYNCGAEFTKLNKSKTTGKQSKNTSAIQNESSKEEEQPSNENAEGENAASYLMEKIKGIKSLTIIAYDQGLIVGSNKGNLLFIEKNKTGEYIPVRYTYREKEATVVSLTFTGDTYDYLGISFSTNEIAYISLKDIFSNLKNENFEIYFNVISDGFGFHNGPITTMDVALQRPIIVTTSTDRTVRVWNYLTGHCEYCKIILEEKENSEEQELEILSIAIHPSGYYIAISDVEMIRFFHLCYKELRFYGNDQIANEPNKSNCTLLKFSNGGHILAAITDKKIHFLRSYSRETIKTVNSPHSGQITAIYFHNSDNFFYTAGNDGSIIQYNLFDFNFIRIANKFVNYNGSALCNDYYIRNYDQRRFLEEDNAMNDKIVSCGIEGSRKSTITHLQFNSSKVEDANQVIYETASVEHQTQSICNIHTKRFDISAFAIGTTDGSVALFGYNFGKKKKEEEEQEEYFIPQWDIVKPHNGNVKFLYYCKDTNLLFSAGEDGNLFISAIYEYPDGETVAFEENKSLTLVQLGSILDEGLGDNVLLSLIELFQMIEEMKKQKESNFDLKKIAADTQKNFEKKLKQQEIDLTKKRDADIKELEKKIEELKVQQQVAEDRYQEDLNNLEQENRIKINQRETDFNDKCNELNEELSNLRQENQDLKIDYDKKLEGLENDNLRKFKEFEFRCKMQLQSSEVQKEELMNQIEETEKLKTQSLNLIEKEHERELQNFLQKYTNILTKNEKELEEKTMELAKEKKAKEKLERDLTTNENDLKKYKEENERLNKLITILKDNLENKEKEKDDLKLRIGDIEQNYQEKTKVEVFSTQLKNELYKRNVELTKKFNNEVEAKEELQDSTKALEKQLEETLNILLSKEKEMNKQKLLIEELKQKNEEQRKSNNIMQKNLDNLLRKIYDSFQTNDKRLLIKGMREIYHHYLSQDAEKNFDSNKLNPNLLDELERQLNFLQNQLNQTKEGKTKRENFQKFEYRKIMGENSSLIGLMCEVKKRNNDMDKEIKELKFQNMLLKNELNKAKLETKKEKNYAKQIAKTQETNRRALGMQNQIKGGHMDTSASISTNPSELPIITNVLSTFETTLDNRSPYKNMKNRIFKPGNLSVPNERLLKFSEMKRIIQNKNNVIMRLSAENDVLRKVNFSYCQTNTSRNNTKNDSGEYGSIQKNEGSESLLGFSQSNEELKEDLSKIGKEKEKEDISKIGKEKEEMEDEENNEEEGKEGENKTEENEENEEEKEHVKAMRSSDKLNVDENALINERGTQYKEEDS